MESDSECSLSPIVKSNSSNFILFTEDIDKRDFGYDEIFYKITTHGRSHLSLQR